MEKLLIIVGLPGSGKSFAAEVVKEEFKASVFKSGDLIREEIKSRGLKYTPENDAKIAHWFHTSGRERLLIKRLFDKIERTNRKLVVVDGLRSVQQLKYVKSHFESPIIIYIKSSFESRAKRELKRKRFKKGETKEYIRFRDRLEKSHGVLGLINKANYTIDNTSLTMPRFRNEVIKLVKNIA
ncbi:MAG: AAA family ATPase [Candidatus Aenigmarchaeota archaeon]|nr:AAA family ATPase [Candidatus Aenigmarchaeota archaeon]